MGIVQSIVSVDREGRNVSKDEGNVLEQKAKLMNQAQPMTSINDYIHIRDEFFSVRKSLAEKKYTWLCSLEFIRLETILGSSLNVSIAPQCIFTGDLIPAFIVGTTLFYFMRPGACELIKNYNETLPSLYSYKMEQLDVSKADDMFKIEAMCKIINRFCTNKESEHNSFEFVNEILQSLQLRCDLLKQPIWATLTQKFTYASSSQTSLTFVNPISEQLESFSSLQELQKFEQSIPLDLKRKYETAFSILKIYERILEK